MAWWTIFLWSSVDLVYDCLMENRDSLCCCHCHFLIFTRLSTFYSKRRHAFKLSYLHSLIYCTLHEDIISTKIYVWIILFTPPPLLARNVCNETFLKLNNIFGQFGIFIQWHEITNNNVDAELMLSHCLNFLQLTKQWKQCIWYENKEVVSSVSSYLQVSLLSLCSEWRHFRS